MTEKLGKDESIARVYQFLSTKDNWKTEADTNNDGTIIGTEFSGFMLKFETQWNGEHKYDANDIINQFWSSVNVNQSGKANAKGTSNKIALDKQEIEKLESNIKYTEAINALITRVSGYQCPAGLTDVNRWKNSMQASLLAKASGFTGSIDNQEEIIAYLKTVFQESAVKTNADCIKDQLMNTEFSKIKSDYPDYKYMEDSTLANIINNYIKSLNGTETFQDIMDSIKCLMNDYFSVSGVPNQSAGTVGSSTAFDIPEYDENGQVATNEDGTAKARKRASETTADDRLNKFGGYDNYGMLNDLQKAIVTKNMNSAIDEALKADNTYKSYYTANPADFKDIISSYIDGKVNSASSRDFESLKNFSGATFISEKASELETVKNNIDTLNGKRESLFKKVKPYLSATGEYAQDKKDAVTKVFGSGVTNETALQKAVYALDEATLAAKEAEFDTEIGKINKRLPSSFLSKLPSEMSAVQGGSSSEVQLDTYYLPAYNTGDLIFKATGFGLTVSNGVVSVKSDTVGAGIGTIEVYDKENNLLASKPVNVKVIEKMDIATSNANFNGNTIANIMNTKDNFVKLNSYWKHDNEVVSAAVSGLKTYVNQIANALSGKYDSKLLENAKQNTISYFTAIINSVMNNVNRGSTSNFDEKRTMDFTWVDANKKSHQESGTFINNQYSDESDVSGRFNSDISTSGIAVNVSYQGSDTFQITLNSQVLLRKFESFFNM